MNDDLDLSAVAADAALLDALAAGDPPDDDALLGLASLRAALDEDLDAVLAAPTSPPLQAAPVGQPVGLRRPVPGQRRARTAAALLTGVTLALGTSGVAAATYDARPGDGLYGLRTAVAGPRDEDPRLLGERLDAVQERLRSGDPASQDAARRELGEVAALLDELDPRLRTGLEQRHGSLTARLAASETTPGTAGEPAAPTGPPSAVTPPAGPGAARPSAPVQGPRTAPPSAPPSASPATPPSAPPADRPSAEPNPPRETARPEQTEPGRPSAQPTPSRTPKSAQQPGATETPTPGGPAASRG